MYCTSCGKAVDDNSKFCSFCGTIIANDNSKLKDESVPVFTPSSGEIPKFSAQGTSTDEDVPNSNDDTIPIFAAPPKSHFNEPRCHYHSDELAVARCARCGKPLCQDCCDSYGVSSGRYAGKHLCYDCCVELVTENVEILKKNKKKIIAELIFSPWIFVFRCFGGIFKGVVELTAGNFMAGLGIMFGYGIKFYIELFQGIKYLISTAKAEKSDKLALQQIKDYMEYTRVRNQNKGIDLKEFMREGNVLYGNSYAQAVIENGEATADAMLRKATTTIAENGEIIRSFVA